MVVMQEKVYSDSKKEIRSVLLTYQSGISLNEFQKSYRQLVGQRLPSRNLGFNSDIDFLKSMPDVVHVSTNSVGNVMLTGIADESCEHIERLVHKSRKPKPKNKPDKNGSSFSNSFCNRPNNRYNRPPFVPGTVRAEMLKIIAMYPEGITLPNFVLAYRKKFNKYLHLEQGLETLEKMLSVVSDLEMKLVRNEKKIFLKNCENRLKWNQTNVKKETTARSPHEREGQVHEVKDSSFDRSGIPEDVQNNFKLVLKKCPDGIGAIHFPILYENFIGKPFDIHELGYSSLANLVDSLPKIFKRISDPSNSKMWIILPADAEESKSSKSLKSLQLSLASKKSNRSDSDNSSPSSHKKLCKSIPDDCASPLLQYEEPRMPDGVDLNKIPIFVSAIVSPGLFWFQLQTNEAIDELEKLEHDLESFYGDYYSNKYNMLDSDILIGAACVVLCPDDNLFYRAIIKSIPSIDLVNIFFVDYGSRENVPRTHLRYVRSQYLDYPAHAFKAHLTGLIPPNNASSWDTRAQQRFIDLCERASLMAILKLVDKETYSVELCDTNGNNEIYINDVLVKEGHANFCLDNSFDNSSFLNSANSVGNNVPSNIGSNFTLMASTNTLLELPRSGCSDSDMCTVQRSLESKKENSYSNLNQNSVNKKLSFSPEKQHNDVEREISEEPSEQYQKRYIKPLKLCKDSAIHVFNYEDKPYVSGGELSKLFWDDKDAAYLAERLKFKNVEVPAKTISKQNNSELFNQCSCSKLCDLESNCKSLTLYPLEWAFKILNIFGHPSVCVRFAMRNEIETFDPHCPIWQEFISANNDLDELEKEIEEKLGKLCLYDLQTKREVLKLKKLKLVRLSSDASTDEIRRVDNMQYFIEKRIEHIESICVQFSS